MEFISTIEPEVQSELTLRDLSDLPVNEVTESELNLRDLREPVNEVTESNSVVSEDISQITVGSHHVNESDSGEVISLDGRSILCTPKVPEDLKPVIGKEYDTLGACIEMYRKYAYVAGFDVRLSTQRKKQNGSVYLRILVCSRDGKPRDLSYDSLEDIGEEKRCCNVKVTGCLACVRFRKNPKTSKFKLYLFRETHNHSMVSTEKKHLLRSERQLSYADQLLVHTSSGASVGPSKLHKLLNVIRGGYQHVGGTRLDFKNCRRDLNQYIGDYDAQMLVNKMENRRLCVKNFSFEYKCEKRELMSLFWADETSKIHYEAFGDVISFDATFKTNKYKMVFIPFTGVDNHYKSVTFGGGLLRSESIESYKWLLKAFLSAHSKKQPTMVLTDQDPALIQAIPLVFTDAKHRLCMWHIMNKLPLKVCKELLDNTDFRKRLHKLVWNVFLDPKDFEEGWILLIQEFGLHANKWLTDMFEIRTKWIPAYFKHLSMCGLMKTTSRSESSNSFFGNFSHEGNTFVSFMMCFEAAMETQRNNQDLLDHATDTTTPKRKTPLKIEVHASLLYTREIFKEVQKEIYKGIYACAQKSVTETEGVKVYEIIHKDKRCKNVAELKVVYNQADGTVVCKCMHFSRHGYFCRHIFHVFHSNDVHEIPSQYVLRRWRRDALPPDMIKIRNMYRDINHVDKFAYGIYSDVNYCVRLLSNNVTKFAVFHEKIAQLRSEMEADLSDQLILSKEEIMTSVIGVSRPENINIEVPTGINNKGCRKRKRKVGAREEGAKKSKKKKRLCKKCKKLVRHDSRNCERETAKLLATKAARAAKKALNVNKSRNDAEEYSTSDEEYSTSDGEYSTSDEEQSAENNVV